MDRKIVVVRAVCFDFDNTLQDLDAAFDVAATKVLEPFVRDRGYTLADVKNALNGTWPSVWDEFMAGTRPEPALYPEWFRRAFHTLDVLPSPDQLSLLVAQYHQVFDSALALFPDVDRALLRVKNWRRPPDLAILTNGPGERQRMRIRALGLDWIPHLVISEEVGIGKPHPEFFHTALRALDVRPEHAVMVGDTVEADIVGARSVGMMSIWLNRRKTADPRSALADATVGDLDDAVQVMESWTSEG